MTDGVLSFIHDAVTGASTELLTTTLSSVRIESPVLVSHGCQQVHLSH